MIISLWLKFWVFFPFMDCFFVEFNHIFNRTDCRNIFPLHGPLYCGILNWAFLPFFIHTVYMSIWQLHGNIPCEAPFCFYLWIDTHTHTGYRNCEKLVFLLLSKGVSSPSSFPNWNCYFHILLQQGMEKPQVLLYLIINVVMPWRGRHSYSEIQDFILAMIKPSLVLAAGRCNSSHNTVQTRCQYLVWIECILKVLSESPVKMIPIWTLTY